MHDYVRRTLTYLNQNGGLEQIRDCDLVKLAEPLIVLGEPGMGKTWLLQRIAAELGWTFRSAAAFVAHPDPSKLKLTGARLVIDGLDELSAAQESDPVYRVLGQLIKAGCPPFVLSCRAADWRGAVARQDISAEYGVAPREVALEPFSREGAFEFLATTLGAERAKVVVGYLEEKGIPDLYGNPLTLNLFGEVAASTDTLPETRADLMRRASEIMWNERSDRHENSQLSNLSQESALAAAGVASAVLILTGSETISSKPSSIGGPRTIRASELRSLPGGEDVHTILGSRLFKASPGAQDQFKPIHRAVAEFLGARWLIESIKDDQALNRALAMMTIDGGVPASLRGIHAWLAQDDRFASDVIATDPYGVLRYGDGDGLSVKQGRHLLQALKALQQANPYFRADDWGRHSAKGITHMEMREDIRSILFAHDTTYHLRTLLLGVIGGSELATSLLSDLRKIVMNDASVTLSFAEREDAAAAIMAIGPAASDWPAVVALLSQMTDRDSRRLALSILRDVGFDKCSSQQIVQLVVAYASLRTDVAGDGDDDGYDSWGTLIKVAHDLPDSQLTAVLDGLSSVVGRATDGDQAALPGVALLILRLVARQVAVDAPEPIKLLKWLRATIDCHGYAHEERLRIAAFLQTATDVRRAIQHHIVFVEGGQSMWSDIWRLGEIAPSLFPGADDVIYHLSLLSTQQGRAAGDVEVWRSLAALARRTPERAAEILDAARPFVCGDAEMEQYLAELTKAQPVPDWELNLATRRRREASRKQGNMESARRDFANNRVGLRAGELVWVYPVAQAYLGVFHDVNRALSPPDRVGQWLGADLQADALVGLQAVLARADLPTLDQIVTSYAESIRWNYVLPMIAGISERVRNGLGLAGVPLDVCISGRIAIRHEHLGDSVGDAVCKELDGIIGNEPSARERYVRMLVEPFLAGRRTHIIGIHDLVPTVGVSLTRRLVVEWLSRYHDLPSSVENELIDVLVECNDWEGLREIGRVRREQGYSDEQIRWTWRAVGLIVDPATVGEVGGLIAAEERGFLWHVRHRLGGDRDRQRSVPVCSTAVLAWIVRRFRTLWPRTERPKGVTRGDTNPWDASQFLEAVIARLGRDLSDEAVNECATLVAETEDGYSPVARYAAEQQRRARREMNFQGVTIRQIRNVVCAGPPQTADDLRAVIRHVLTRFRNELRGNDTDVVDKYWADDNGPRGEDWCTDRLIEDMQRLLPPYGIGRIPQADMPKSKTADIIFTIGDVVVPIECKGQWNKKLWSAASDQLDALYLRDARAQDRGIYLVYWFGRGVPANRRLKAPPRGVALPETPEELRERLIASLAPSRRGSIAIEVLDLTK